MTQISDLTFQQLETASGSNNLIIVDNSAGLLIRLSALTGLITTDKNTAGVVQALYKLREFAAKAQVTINLGQPIGERLSAFPPASNGTALNGFVLTSGQIITKTPLANSGIVGASN
jgi:hypothetical protein